MTLRTLRAENASKRGKELEICGQCGLRAREYQLPVGSLSFLTPTLLHVSHARTSRIVRRQNVQLRLLVRRRDFGQSRADSRLDCRTERYLNGLVEKGALWHAQ